MTEDILIGISAIIVLGIGAQLLAWRLKLPAILLLLAFGLASGPVYGVIDPDAIFGDLLLPLVSISVALILFEGGLSLRFSELKGVTGVMGGLMTIGVAVAWAAATAGGYYIVGLDFPIALLLGAVFVVTGPTVIVPLLRHVRPVSRVSSILKWEGIVVDPIGAVLAVLVFEAVIAGGFAEAPDEAVLEVFRTVFVGGVTGLALAWVMVVFLRNYWVPDFLQAPVALGLAVLSFAVSGHFQEESGLVAVTVMGIYLANQRSVSVKNIIEFKENLRVLLISTLFIILAARLDMADFEKAGVPALYFLAFLIVVARPLSVYLSTIGSGLDIKERVFIMCVAPRGIVAAAIASVFALRLAEIGHPQAELMVPLTFIVIIGTVAIYGLGALPLAKLLGLARVNPQGVLIAGGHRWARDLAKLLKDEGFEVLVVDDSWANVTDARYDGIPAWYGSLLSESLPEDVDLGGFGRLLALSRNDNVNTLAVVHFTDLFGRGGVYRLAPESEKGVAHEFRGRGLFGEEVTFGELYDRYKDGAVIKKTKLTDEFDYEKFTDLYGGEALPLFVINEKGELRVFAADDTPEPASGQTVVALARPAVGGEGSGEGEDDGRR